MLFVFLMVLINILGQGKSKNDHAHFLTAEIFESLIKFGLRYDDTLNI